METRSEAACPDEARWVFNERVVVQYPQYFRLDIGRAIERVHQQAAGARVQGQSHGIYGEIAAAQVFHDAGRPDDRSTARLLMALGPRHGDFRSHAARQHEVKRF